MNVHTWADGFGNWHARTTEYGVGFADMAQRVAHAAIAAELVARDENVSLPDLTVKMTDRNSSRDGGLVTEFVEQWPNDDDTNGERMTIGESIARDLRRQDITG